MAYEIAGAYQGADETAAPQGVRLNEAVSRLEELAKRLSLASETLAGPRGPEPASDERNRPALVAPTPGLIEARADDLQRIASMMAADLERIERLLP